LSMPSTKPAPLGIIILAPSICSLPLLVAKGQLNSFLIN
jgi:hypothetical protein